jgi:mono/diheme cytochrome c family protein
VPVGGVVKTGRWLSIAAALTATAVVGWAAAHSPSAAMHIADANDPATVVRGKRIYADHCASCHGRYLQGQPLWQLIDDYAERRAPAHDETGHTWQHPDEDIFNMTKYGRFASAQPSRRSYMPAFRDELSNQDILAVMAFIKARWPLGLRVAQAMLNPGHAGMPAGADKVDWKFPPVCKAVLRQANTSDRLNGR